MATPGTPVMVMARAPIPGKVKTRLAVGLGSDLAARFATAFLVDMWATLRDLPGVRPVLALAGPAAALPGALRAGVELRDQGAGDLGARMERMLRWGCAEAGQAAVVGGDASGLPPGLIRRALASLEERDAAIVPAEDGGFVMLALRRCPRGLLLDLPWGGADALGRTLDRLHERGLSVALLPSWLDVDEVQDLDRLWTLLHFGAVRAPSAGRLLGRVGPLGGALWASSGGGDRRLPAPASAVGISVIIPALNEVRRLPSQLLYLAGLSGIDEVVVADGGSRDGTVAVAEAFPGVRLVRSPPGRARQMNAAATVARGQVLLFLHADVRLPEEAAAHMRHALRTPGTPGGAFLTHHVPDGGRHRLGRLLRLADLRSRYTPHPYGDQAIFVRAEVFREIGGFPDQPLMEDLELSRRLARQGRVARCPAEVEVSGRRFEDRPIFFTALVNLYPLLYRFGVPPERLAAWYRDVR